MNKKKVILIIPIYNGEKYIEKIIEDLFSFVSKNNFKILELPVIIKEKYLKNKGGVSFFRHGFFILKDLLAIHYYNKRKKYE